MTDSHLNTIKHLPFRGPARFVFLIVSTNAESVLAFITKINFANYFGSQLEVNCTYRYK